MLENTCQTVTSHDLDRPRLMPAVHPRIRGFLQENRDMLFDLTERFGSPLNLVFPQNIHDNIRAFQDVYKKYHVRGRIYYTSKPCKSRALFREAAGEDIGIDVSSAGSLKAVMECGWTSDRIGATGPKNKAYITACLQNDVLINVDNIDELKQIVALHGALALDRKARITLRIADTGQTKIQFLGENDTPFGIRTEDMDWVFSYLKEQKSILSPLGFSWHSSTATDEQRMAAQENLLRLTFKAIKSGFKISIINIGGGFPIAYADSQDEWEDYLSALKQSVLRKSKPQIWNKGGLGFRMEDGVLKGNGSFMDHYPQAAKEKHLEKRLSYRMTSMGNVTFADIVRDSLLNLAIEPGSGMLDQCGITLGHVAFSKKSGMGENIIGLEMNRSNLHSNQMKILSEPFVFSQGEDRLPANGEGVFYTGNLCLFYDMLQYNKTYPAFIPQSEDIVAFMNTAPYLMDFTESETLMQPVAAKIALTQTDGAWTWAEDQNYRKTI